MTLFESAGAGGPAQVKRGVGYDGTDFSGFAAQPNQPHVRTIGGVLGSAIGKVLRHDVELTCSGRTDAGVHAWGQVVSFRTQPGLDPWKLAAAVTCSGPRWWCVRASSSIPSSTRGTPRSGGGIDARSSTGRCRIRSAIGSRGGSRNRSSYALRLAADPFVGDHDFASFCRKGRRDRRRCAPCSSRPGSTRATVCCATRSAPRSAGRWCAIVGTLVEVGVGKRRPGEMLGIIAARDRGAAGQLAPPRGLCLWDVGF